MSKVLKSSELLKSIKRRAMLPKDQDTFTDEEFLDMANEEIGYFGVQHVMSVHEEYFVTFEEEAIQPPKVKYTIPYRSIGTKLRELTYVERTGTIPDPLSERYFEMSRVSLEDISDFNQDNLSSNSRLFYVEDNKIVLLDRNLQEGYLRKWFYIRPNNLVEEDKVGVISSIDRNTGIITLTNFPKNFASAPMFDFIQDRSPNKILDYDMIPSSIDQNTKSLTFTTTDIPEDLAVGDHIAIAGETMVPQLPTELHPIIAQRVAVAALEALGDQEGLTMAQSRLKMMENSTLDILDNRVEGANEKIVNRHSTLRNTVLKRTGRNRGWS